MIENSHSFPEPLSMISQEFYSHFVLVEVHLDEDIDPTHSANKFIYSFDDTLEENMQVYIKTFLSA